MVPGARFMSKDGKNQAGDRKIQRRGNMAKRFGVVFSAVLLVFSMVGTAGAAAVYTYDGIAGGTWSDVNKNNVAGAPDSLLCWAAAGSNSLAYTGWRGWDSGTSTYISSASDIYSRFVGAWPNTVGASTYAYEWWMTNRTQSIIEDPPGTTAKVFPSAGLNFYPGVNVQAGAGSVTAFVKDQAGSLGNVYDFMGTYIGAHRGIVASIDIPFASAPGGVLGHAISVWGWDPSAMQIFITDSDDGSTGIKTYSFTGDTNTAFVIQNYSNLYTTARNVTIGQLTRLNINDTNIEPEKGTVPPVPEPGTLLLLGSGLVGLIGYRRRKN